MYENNTVGLNQEIRVSYRREKLMLENGQTIEGLKEEYGADVLRTAYFYVKDVRYTYTLSDNDNWSEIIDVISGVSQNPLTNLE